MIEVTPMNTRNEKGFSIVELLIVVVIIGILAAVAVPALQRAVAAAENRSVHATMRTMSSAQATFFSQNQRFARLDELNRLNSNGLGTLDVNRIFRNNFTFEMSPLDPSDVELKDGYNIAAYRTIDGVIYRYELTNDILVRVLPDAEEGH